MERNALLIICSFLPANRQTTATTKMGPVSTSQSRSYCKYLDVLCCYKLPTSYCRRSVAGWRGRGKCSGVGWMGERDDDLTDWIVEG